MYHIYSQKVNIFGNEIGEIHTFSVGYSKNVDLKKSASVFTFYIVLKVNMFLVWKSYQHIT